jgi:hypothetical protein
MNRSKDLRKLFKTYMARKEEESRRPVSYNYGRSQQYYNDTFRGTETFHGVIFFYEWSDVTNNPLRYFSLSLFEKFLTESDIELEAWQRDVILNLQQVYIACMPGKKELVVRSSYEALKLAMTRTQSLWPQQLSLVAQGNETPKLLPSNRISPMYQEQYY